MLLTFDRMLVRVGGRGEYQGGGILVGGGLDLVGTRASERLLRFVVCMCSVRGHGLRFVCGWAGMIPFSACTVWVGVLLSSTVILNSIAVVVGYLMTSVRCQYRREMQPLPVRLKYSQEDHHGGRDQSFCSAWELAENEEAGKAQE